jgi:predicted RNA polymerase sigma factor
MNEALLRSLTPSVIGILVRRGADFAAAEDAVQDALVEAVRVWTADPPRDPKGWLVTVAWRRFLDATRAEAGRRRGPRRRWTTRFSFTSCVLIRR